MLMQHALDIAFETNAYARPRRSKTYTYRYQLQGRNLLLHIQGRDRFGVLRSGPFRALTKQEVDADWIVCDHNGSEFDPAVPKGMTIKSLLAEIVA